MFLPWNASTFKQFIDSYESMVKPDHTPNYILGNHDQPRVASRFGIQQAKLLAFLQMTLRGIPIIYYGEELGMQNGSMQESEIKDPFGQVNPLFNRDPSRTPMQWSQKKNAGFSSQNTWLPINKDYKEINVETEQTCKDSMLYFYRSIISLRKKTEALLYGSYEPHDSNNSSILSFKRNHASESLTMFMNFSDKKEYISLNQKSGSIIFSTLQPDSHIKLRSLSRIALDPYSGIIIQS